jgi:hypothetical protein
MGVVWGNEGCAWAWFTAEARGAEKVCLRTRQSVLLADGRKVLKNFRCIAVRITIERIHD